MKKAERRHGAKKGWAEVQVAAVAAERRTEVERAVWKQKPRMGFGRWWEGKKGWAGAQLAQKRQGAK